MKPTNGPTRMTGRIPGLSHLFDPSIRKKLPAACELSASRMLWSKENANVSRSRMACASALSVFVSTVIKTRRRRQAEIRDIVRTN